MRLVRRYGLSAAQRTEIWRRWKAGDLGGPSQPPILLRCQPKVATAPPVFNRVLPTSAWPLMCPTVSRAWLCIWSPMQNKSGPRDASASHTASVSDSDTLHRARG